MNYFELVESVKGIKDPYEMLQFVVDNSFYFGGDSYYAVIRRAMLEQCDLILSIKKLEEDEARRGE